MTKKLFKKYLIITLIAVLTFTFNIIPVSAKSDKLIVGGEVFGLKLYCKGVMVTDFESFNHNGEMVCPGKDSGIKENDIITEVNSIELNTNEKLEEIVKKSAGDKLSLKISRNNENITIDVKPLKNEDGNYCIGMWIRDSCAGIGTITYYNPKDNSYGALGHGICDIDTGGLMVSDDIQILSADIVSVTKSNSNSIGTLNGCFTSNLLAKAGYNNDLGVYGKMITLPLKEQYEVAGANEIKLGKAYIYSTVSGNTPEKFSIEITQLCNYDSNSNKNFIFKVTDNRLIEKTGGIVQGMSGSPIIQNNKIIGAITHVIISDPTKGYGIIIENMINCTE